VLLEIDQPFFERGEVFLVDFLTSTPPWYLSARIVRHDHRGARHEARLAALDVEELLRARSAPKPASVTT